MADLNQLIDFTSVGQTATLSDIRSLCAQAMIHKYRAVCVNSAFVEPCYKELRQHPEVIISATAGFPFGGASSRAKIYEAIVAGEKNAKEIDFALNIGYIKERKDKETRSEIKQIVRNTAGLCKVKVIIEAPLLTEEEIVRATTIAAEEGAYCISTATGFSGDTTPEMVKIIKRTLTGMKKSEPVLIKAAGGIDTVEAVNNMVRAGADIIGTSTLIEF